jgi:Tol biopolymer transport system component
VQTWLGLGGGTFSPPVGRFASSVALLFAAAGLVLVGGEGGNATASARAARLSAAADNGSASASAETKPVIVFAADRAPLVSGEVYRVDANGRRVDLSKSPAADTQPSVAPRGSRAAFVSNRGAGTAVYVVGLDGRGLRRVTPELSGNVNLEIAWAMDGRHLAVVASRNTVSILYVARIGASARVVFRAPAMGAPSWSPDGRVVTVRTGISLYTYVDAFTPAGRHLWRVAHVNSAAPGWSRTNRFAAAFPQSIHVYDKQGRLAYQFRGSIAAWSADGTRIASLVGESLQVRASDGRVVFTQQIPALNANNGIGGNPHGLVWYGTGRVAIGDIAGGGQIAVRLADGTISPAPASAFAQRSPDGQSVVQTDKAGDGFAVNVSSLDGSNVRTFTHVPGCYDDGGFAAAAASLQFTADSRSLVFQSECLEPFDNLYAVSSDGTDLRRLTNVNAQQMWPQVSPDGTRIAYSQAPFTGLSCKGCPDSVWVSSSDGSQPTQLTANLDGTFDSFPTWSPDGRSILFSRSTFDSFGELLVIPAAGGAVRDLHVHGDQAAWGPTRIAYIRLDTTPSSLWTIAPDGSDKRQIATTGNLGPPADPAWSHDGRLAYLVQANSGVVSLVEITGTSTRRIQLPLIGADGLAWSPDGTHFGLTGRTRTNAGTDAYTIDTNGHHLTRLTTNIGASGGSWSP